MFKLLLNAACRWETGYWGTMDIAHDRAGYYLCWGCLNWVPAIYTSPALYITEHPMEWSLPAAITIGVAGATAIYVNYDSDRQRQVRSRPQLSSLHPRRGPVTLSLACLVNLAETTSGGSVVDTGICCDHSAGCG